MLVRASSGSTKELKLSSQVGNINTGTSQTMKLFDSVFMPAMATGSKIKITFTNEITQSGMSGGYQWFYSFDQGSTYTYVNNGQSATLDLYGKSHLSFGIYNRGNNYNVNYWYTIEIVE